MSTAIKRSLSPPRSWNLRPVGHGFIGIDIDSHAIQIAQSIQHQGRSRASAQWQLSLAAEHRIDDSQGLAAALRYLRTQWPELRSMFRGSHVAVTLPMHLTPLRTLEIPDGTRAELQAMVRDELSDELGTRSPFTFAFWHSKPSEAGVAHLTAVAVDYEISQSITSELLACGLQCRILDSLPCVLARAAQVTEMQSDRLPAAGPYAVLNFADQTSQLFFCRDGQPGFCRMLTNCGLAQIHEFLQSRLQLSRFESDLLLNEVGLSERYTGNHAVPTIGPIITPAIDQILHEVQRTLTYTATHYADQFPQRLWIFGAGAQIRDLAAYIADKLAIDVQVGDASFGASPEHSAVFAAAHRLSAARWEASPCR